MSDRDTSVDERTVTQALERAAAGPLGPWLLEQRWSGAKGRAARATSLLDVLALDAGPPATVLALLEVRLADDAGGERYAVALRVGADAGAGGEGAIAQDVSDGSDADAVPRGLLALMLAGATRGTTRGGLARGWVTAAAEDVLGAQDPLALPMRRLRGEQSNTSYAVGDRAIVKLLRRPVAGTHPEVELLEFLTRVGFAHAPRLVGAVEYRAAGVAGAAGEGAALALAQEFVASRGDAWQTTLDALGKALADGRGADESAAALEALGEVTGALHAALASEPEQPAFAPEPLTVADRDLLAASVRERLAELDRLRVAREEALGPQTAARIGRLCARASDVDAALRRAEHPWRSGLHKTRIHGDYHLGQVLATEHGFVVIDFEGEPLRSLAARREKASPLRDVAGMLRSLDYAARAAQRERDGVEAALVVHNWERAAREAFLAGYLARASGAAAPVAPREREALLDAVAPFELDKALYEIHYELLHRPDWVDIPLAGAERAVTSIAR